MAYDLIRGETPVNWARGTEKLLPHTPTSTSMGRDPRKRLHHLRKIVRRAARGDTNAFAQMQQVRQRLSQRAAMGDARAMALLQKITVWYAADRAQYQGSSPAAIQPWPSLAQPPGAPPVIPPSSDVYYPATSFPSTPPGASDEYDDESVGISLSLRPSQHGRFYNPRTGWHTYGSLNDDERAVALDGGSCEREAFARMRGWMSPGAARSQRYQQQQYHAAMRGAWYKKLGKGVTKGIKSTGHGLAKGLKAIPKALAAIPQAIAPPGGSLMGVSPYGQRNPRPTRPTRR